MAITTIFDFTSPSDYTTTNITIAEAVAALSLIANPDQTFSQPFTSTSGFTYNSSNTSISGGILSQIKQEIIPTFTNLVNVTTGIGTVTKNAGGSAWNAGATSVQQINGDGFVQITVGSNVTNQMIGLATSNPAGNYIDINYAIYFDGGNISIYELGTSKSIGASTYTVGDVFQVIVEDGVITYTKNDVAIYTSLVSATFPMYFACAIFPQGEEVSGITLQDEQTDYLGDIITFPTFSYSGIGSIVSFTGFSSDGDLNSPGYILNGLYWNGMAWVSSNNTYAQSNPIDVISTYINQLPNNNALTIKVITVTSSSPMSITGPVTITYSGQIYPTLGGTIESNSTFAAQELLTFAAALAESGSDSVTFGLVVNNQLMYWNGSAWANSNGTLAQTNTAAVINTNAPTLLSVNSNVAVFALLISGTGSTTPSLTTMTVQYTFGSIEPTVPATTIVFGFLRDVMSNPIVGATINFALVNLIPNAYMAASQHILLYSSVNATTDMNGYFEQPVIATTQFQGSNTFVQVTIAKGGVVENVGSNGLPLYLTIPVQESIDITSILSA